MKTDIQSTNSSISDEMCRLCLNHCDDENSVEIFFSNDLSLTVRIMACAGLEVTQQDSLPKRICVECRLTLEKSFLFRNKCKNSDSKLRRHIRLINSGKVSRVFDDSEDEFEDDYTESIKLINDLQKRLEQKQKADEIIEYEQRIARNQHDTKNVVQIKDHNETFGSGTSLRTRSSNRLKNNSDSKNVEVNTTYDGNNTIEVLMDDDLDDEHDVEYVIAHATEEPLISNEDTDDLNAMMTDENEFEAEPFLLQDINKRDELDISEESTDDKDMDDDDPEFSEDYCDATLLETILPTIKQSVAAKSGTVLDDETQYKIIRTAGNEIKVQCIASDGKEFEIEMVQQPNIGYERDESGDLKIFACSKCPKTFSRRGKLINHERDHSAKSNGQECPYCQKWFPSNSTLTRHIRVHTGEKPFKCSICSRSFIQKEILKRHLMTHSGERPFKCAHCPKSFILKEALRQHINRNHTENPTPEMHNCPFCPKSFCHSSGLSRHLLIHAGRTFACEYCAKKFNDKSALKRHTASIHMAKNKK